MKYRKEEWEKGAAGASNIAKENEKNKQTKKSKTNRLNVSKYKGNSVHCLFLLCLPFLFPIEVKRFKSDLIWS